MAKKYSYMPDDCKGVLNEKEIKKKPRRTRLNAKGNCRLLRNN